MFVAHLPTLVHAAFPFLPLFVTNPVLQASKFDFVFIDADKRQYRAYHDFLLGSDMLTDDAVILADNVLFKGLVLNSGGRGGDKKLNYWAKRHQDIADELHSYNEYVITDTRVEAVLVPLRDGLTLIRRVRK